MHCSLLSRALRSLALMALASPCVAPCAPVDFSRDILPILSDACFHCHGPDEKAREAGLRLDTREGAFRTHDGVTVVAPGKPAGSELVLRVASDDRDEQMPPPKARRQLTPEEKALIERWVAEGAKWGRHWAFEPMQKRQELPGILDRGNPIDFFIRARLQAEGLAPAPEADRERLLRRVSLDLTGLPPTPEETDAFLADASPGAFEKVVDRLLASPRYGERMASDWLDLARYADTHGYQMDRPRAMWPWRDWVIKAFNENLPFDQFATWQLAGDLLPGATKEQRLATGFNRLHCQNEEGGIVEEEYRVAYVADRVNTFGTAFLGMTFECARCHDHKYDPISQRDVYALFSFFQNIDEAGQIPFKGFADAMPLPTMPVTTDEQDRQLAALRAEVARAEQALKRVQDDARPAFVAWLADKGPFPERLPGLVAAFAFDALASGKTANVIDPTKPGKAHETPTLVAGKHGQAAELDGESGFTFPGVGHFKRSDPFSLSLWLQAPAHSPRMVVAHHTKAPVDAASRGYELLLEGGRVAFGLHYYWPGSSLKVRTKQAVPVDAWTHVAATYDGSGRAAGARIFIDGKPVPLEVVRDGLTKDITYENGEPDLAIGYRFRDAGFNGGRIDELGVWDRALTALEATQLAGREDLKAAWNAAPDALTPSQREDLFTLFTASAHEAARAAAGQLRTAREAESRFVGVLPEVMVMAELPQPKPAFVLQRGAYDAPGDPVSADTPHALPPFPAGAPRNRLGLAQWLFEPEHPLTARVTVNRLWQMMFGRGMVETSDNFGTQGAAPSHPELLDWLARDFIASGWDVKAILRKIALSETYRQSSRASPELLSRDPQNVLLARGPARRLTAEMLRDAALTASGLLVEKLGGPSVKPYQPPGLWEEIAMGKPRYEQGMGEDLRRRSVYTFWKRTVPPPVMVTFDSAERNVCAARRQSTSTPLQALALLNDVQIVEAARAIAQRALQQCREPEDAMAWSFRAITGRRPRTQELPILTALFREQHTLFSSEPGAAQKLLAVGESKRDPALDPVLLAAHTVVAKALLNFDEAVMRR